MGRDTSETATNNDSWRDTLYIWDGIVMLQTDKMTKKENGGGDEEGKEAAAVGKNDDDGVPIQWEGTWVSEEAADATQAPAPKRNAFAEFVESDVRFNVEGVARPFVVDEDDDAAAAASDGKDGGDEGSGDAKSSIPPPFIVKLVSGAGWEMDDDESGKKSTKPRYHDEVHDVLVKSLRWSGNMYDQTENIIVARGKNEFGSFISAGWMRPGNRWTLARRYLPDGDPRVDWTLKQLLDHIVDQSVTTVEDTGQRKVRIPCWQCPALHADHTKSDPAVDVAAAEEANTDGEKAATGDHASKAEQRGEKRKANEETEEGKDSDKLLKQ